MLLAMDISTSIIGWSLWEEKILKEQGYYKLSDSKNEPKELDKKLDKAIEYFSKFKNIDKIAAEAAMQRFGGGKTTANTLNKLIAINFALTYNLSRLWKVPVVYIPVREARKKAGIEVPRQPKGQKKDPAWAKKIVVEALAKKYSMVKFEMTKTGNPKSGIDDMADSIVIGIAATH